jgi:hypothetical protein
LDQTPHDLRLWNGRAYRRSARKEQVGSSASPLAAWRELGVDRVRGAAPKAAEKEGSFFFALQKIKAPRDQLSHIKLLFLLQQTMFLND